MIAAVRAFLLAVLLAGPVVLAFFSGGFFDQPRLLSALVACGLVLAAALLCHPPLPRSSAGRTALGGLLLLTVWSGISLTWAPLRDPAIADLQRLILYLAALTAAAAFLRPARGLRWVEPALGAGALVVIGYGLSDRLLPGLVKLTRSASAGGRLEQPLTYWNAMGAVAAVGLVLCARLAGDSTRPAALRGVAAAAAVPLGAGVYLSFSRGALAAVAVGLLVLAVLQQTRPQLRSIAMVLVAGALAAAVGGAFDGVRSLEGGAGARQAEGAVALTLMLLLALAAAGAQARECRAERAGRRETGALGFALARGPALVAVGLVLAGAVLLTASSGERRPAVRSPAFGADPARLSSFESNRYAYWQVAGRSFARQPLIGAGAGGFRVDWLREREIPETVRDAHSLYLETAAELGLVGLAALALLMAGVAAAGRAALRADRDAAVGPLAALSAWALHAGLDWNWEMPAVSLPAIVLAGALIARSELPSGPSRADATSPPIPARPAPPGGSPQRGGSG